MALLRVAACLVALLFACAPLAGAADVTYSGIPGKWRRGTKGTKNTAAEPAAKPKAKGTKKIIDDGKLKVTVGPKKG